MLSTIKKTPPALLPKSLLTQEQIEGVNRLYEYDHTFMVAGMGAGKTIMTLTAALELLFEGVISKVLIVAPLKVAQSVWRDEALKWEHTANVHISVAIGDEKVRKSAISEKSGITVINIECLPWFFETYGANHGYDGLVIDEISKFKDSGTVGFKKLRRRIEDFTWRVGLTGTPVHENFIGLYSQMMIIDGGASLGTRKDEFLDRYFYATDFKRRNWVMFERSAKQIVQAIHQYVHLVPDYSSELPDLNIHEQYVELDDYGTEVYEALARDSVIQMAGEVISGDTEAVLVGKLEQVANGFIYDMEGNAHSIHIRKQNALLEVVPYNKKAVIVYDYSEDLRLIQQMYPDAVCLTGTSRKQLEQIKADWIANKIQHILMHPKSGGHGLDFLKHGCCDMVIFSPIWSHDLFDQTVARLWRRGQENKVTVQILVAEKTIDEVKLIRVEEKEKFDLAFREHLKKFS